MNDKRGENDCGFMSSKMLILSHLVIKVNGVFGLILLFLPLNLLSPFGGCPVDHHDSVENV